MKVAIGMIPFLMLRDSQLAMKSEPSPCFPFVYLALLSFIHFYVDDDEII